jgi:hypothetical protein
MKITAFGKQQIQSKRFRADMLDMAMTAIHFHKTPEADVRRAVARMIAKFLAGIDEKHPFTSDDDIDEFMAANDKLIRPILDEAMEGAVGAKVFGES